jgi:hypothetical protein
VVARTCAWLAAGGILLFAVSGHPGFLNLQVVGIILLGRGVAGFWCGIGREGRAHYSDRFKAALTRGISAFEAVTADLAGDGGRRVALDELLSPRRQPDRN